MVGRILAAGELLGWCASALGAAAVPLPWPGTGAAQVTKASLATVQIRATRSFKISIVWLGADFTSIGSSSRLHTPTNFVTRACPS